MPPEIFNPLNVTGPAPPRVFAGPLKVIVSAFASSDPFTVRSPAMLIELAVEMEPVTTRWFRAIPFPLIEFPEPLIVSLPVPPGLCVNEPMPVVEKFPATERSVPGAAVTPAPVMTRLLKRFVPAPLTTEPEPANVICPEPPLKVPLLVQFAPTEWANAPPLKVVPWPSKRLPRMVMGARAVKETELPTAAVLVRFPAMVSTAAGRVLVTAPLLVLSVRFP